eukprot:g5776.t1
MLSSFLVRSRNGKTVSRLRYGFISWIHSLSSVPSYEIHSRDTRQLIQEFAGKKQTGVSLKYMLDFGQNPIERQLLLSAQFLHKELPVRLAHRIVELENLPYGLSGKPQILTVRDWYIESLLDLIKLPKPKTFDDDLKFTDQLRSIYNRHANVVPLVAQGVSELKEEIASDLGLKELPEIHQFLDGFYLSRIGIRFLIGQHISIHEESKENYIGLIHTKCSPVRVCEDARDNASDVCTAEFGTAPKVEIYGDPNFTFAYVPSHIHHMVFELIKNSLRAVQDRYADQLIVTPSIRIVVAEGFEDVTIKVSDEGGGIPRSGVPQIWTYLYSTAKSPLRNIQRDGTEAPAVLAGYGYGLPISRLYARYFGGELQVLSMEGYGTDAYLHLNRLGNFREPLP